MKVRERIEEGQRGSREWNIIETTERRGEGDKTSFQWAAEGRRTRIPPIRRRSNRLRRQKCRGTPSSPSEGPPIPLYLVGKNFSDFAMELTLSTPYYSPKVDRCASRSEGPSIKVLADQTVSIDHYASWSDGYDHFSSRSDYEISKTSIITSKIPSKTDYWTPLIPWRVQNVSKAAVTFRPPRGWNEQEEQPLIDLPPPPSAGHHWNRKRRSDWENNGPSNPPSFTLGRSGLRTALSPPPIQGPISTNCFVVYFTFFNIAIVRSFKAISWILRANILGQIRISRIIKLISEGFKFKLRPRAQFFLKRINSCHTANLNFYYRVFLRSKPIFAQLEANHSIPKFLRSQTKDVDSYNLTHKILASDLH